MSFERIRWMTGIGLAVFFLMIFSIIGIGLTQKDVHALPDSPEQAIVDAAQVPQKPSAVPQMVPLDPVVTPVEPTPVPEPTPPVIVRRRTRAS